MAYESEHWDTLTHAHSHWHFLRTVDCEEKMAIYVGVNKNNVQVLEALIAWDTTPIYSRSCPSYVCGHPKKSIQASSPVCRCDIDRLWEKCIHPGWRRGEKPEVRLGPRLSTQSCTQPAQELCGGLCGATVWGPGLHRWGMSGQDPEGYVQGCQLSIQWRGPRVVKSLPRWETLTELGTL